jgi:hypothetical protein
MKHSDNQRELQNVSERDVYRIEASKRDVITSLLWNYDENHAKKSVTFHSEIGKLLQTELKVTDWWAVDKSSCNSKDEIKVKEGKVFISYSRPSSAVKIQKKEIVVSPELQLIIDKYNVLAKNEQTIYDSLTEKVSQHIISEFVEGLHINLLAQALIIVVIVPNSLNNSATACVKNKWLPHLHMDFEITLDQIAINFLRFKTKYAEVITDYRKYLHDLNCFTNMPKWESEKLIADSSRIHGIKVFLDDVFSFYSTRLEDMIETGTCTIYGFKLEDSEDIWYLS